MKQKALNKSALDLCFTLSEKTGKLLVKYFNKKIKSSFKDVSPNLVTEVDLMSESIIVDAIRRAFPDHTIITEESDSIQNDSPFTWYVDPLDGTVNYFRGLPFFGVSLALYRGDTPQVGLVHCPVLRETFWAVKGGGAFYNGDNIHPSKTRRLKESFLVTGFPYHEKGRLTNLLYFNDFILNSMAVRRVGSAALDLCYVAKGVFDGFWELDLKPWDVAAGMLIVAEAKGKLSDFTGERCGVNSGRLVASNGLIHRQMLNIIRKYHK